VKKFLTHIKLIYIHCSAVLRRTDNWFNIAELIRVDKARRELVRKQRDNINTERITRDFDINTMMRKID
jgi:hypothetical protein